MAKKATRKAKGNTPSKQSFTFNAPGALSVLLAGDFTHWQARAIPMRKQGDGFWHAEVELPPGVHHYRFLVDGEWREDPECTVQVPNPFGSRNSVRQVC